MNSPRSTLLIGVVSDTAWSTSPLAVQPGTPNDHRVGERMRARVTSDQTTTRVTR